MKEKKMEIVRNKETNRVDLNWFKSQLGRYRTLTRFCINEPEEEVEMLLLECLRSQTQRRCKALIVDEQVKKVIKLVSSWITNPNEKVGVMLSGKVGNGKTTMMEAIRTLISILRPSESSFEPRTMTINAQEINDMANDSKKDKLQKIKNVDCLFIDDLGCEAENVKVYGNIVSPMTDILYQRYDRRGFMVVTTNMQKTEIQQRYGERIADRFNELFLWITYTAGSYRG